MPNELVKDKKSYWGLPEKVKFCKKCVVSNQRPMSSIEHERTKDYEYKTMQFDNEGVCTACRYAEEKERIDWEDRELELESLLSRYRRSDGRYDCLVPGSGGKDSVYASWLLKYKYNMNPLTCTWPPILYTDYGYQNYLRWIEWGGFDNVAFKQNGKVMKALTRLSIQNMLHPFHTFILGQRNYAPKIAAQFGIPLVFYGEPEVEYCNPIAESETSLREKSYYIMDNIKDVRLSGVRIEELMDLYSFRLADLMPFLPAHPRLFEKQSVDVRYLGYYLKWNPQEAYYLATDKTYFKARPFRTQGTYSKYNSIDDKIDDLHYYTTFIKFGIGRCTHDASQEIRNNHITREEGVALVRKFDGEYPNKYISEVLSYVGIKGEDFHELCDQFRSPHLWKKEGNKWQLKHQVQSKSVTKSSMNNLIKSPQK